MPALVVKQPPLPPFNRAISRSARGDMQTADAAAPLHLQRQVSQSARAAPHWNPLESDIVTVSVRGSAWRAKRERLEARRQEADEWRKSIGLKLRNSGPVRLPTSPPGWLVDGGAADVEAPLLAPAPSAEPSSAPPVLRAAPTSELPVIFTAAASAPLVCALLSAASLHGAVAISTSAALSTLVVMAALGTPIAQTVYTEDEYAISSAAMTADGGSGSLFTAAECEAPPTHGLAGVLHATSLLLKLLAAWALQLLVGVLGLVNVAVVLYFAPPPSLAALIVAVFCFSVQLSDGFGALGCACCCSSQGDGSGRDVAAAWLASAAALSRERLSRATVLAADVISTRAGTLIASRGVIGVAARRSLQLTKSASSRVVALVHVSRPWWSWLVRGLDELGARVRHSPLKVLVVLFSIVEAVEGLDQEVHHIIYAFLVGSGGDGSGSGGGGSGPGGGRGGGGGGQGGTALGAVGTAGGSALAIGDENADGAVDGLDVAEHVGILTSIGSLLLDLVSYILLAASDTTAAVATGLTAFAATTEFVRRRVRPEEFEASRLNEAARRARAHHRASAIHRLQRAMGPPLVQIDLDELDGAIGAAEQTPGVAPSLLATARLKYLGAREAQDKADAATRAAIGLLERLMRQPPLSVDLAALAAAVDGACEADAPRALTNAAIEALQSARRLQRERSRAEERLRHAVSEPTHLEVGRGTPPIGVRIDTSELGEAIREGRDAWVDPQLLNDAEATLLRSVDAQRQLTIAVSAFFGRLRARATHERRRVMAATRLTAAAEDADAALQRLQSPSRVSELLGDAVAELSDALTHATDVGCDDVSVLSNPRATLHAAAEAAARREAAREPLRRAQWAAKDALAGLAHASSASVVTVLMKLKLATDAAEKALIETAMLRDAHEVYGALLEAEAQRAAARSQLLVVVERLSASDGTGAHSVVADEASREAAWRAVAIASAACVDVALVSTAETQLRVATLAASVVAASRNSRTALDELQASASWAAARRWDAAAAAGVLSEAVSQLAAAIEAAEVGGADVAMLNGGREALEETRGALEAHVAARDALSDGMKRTRLAQRAAENSKGVPATVAELSAAVAALEESVHTAKRRHVSTASIREAQLMLTRARAMARSMAG